MGYLTTKLGNIFVWCINSLSIVEIDAPCFENCHHDSPTYGILFHQVDEWLLSFPCLTLRKCDQSAFLQFFTLALPPKVRGLRFHPSGKYLLAGSRDGCMKIIDIQEGQVIYVIETEHGSVNGVDFSPSGGYFASVGEQQKVIIWKFPGGSSFVGTSKDTPNKGIKSRVSTLENQGSKEYSSSQPEVRILHFHIYVLVYSHLQ